MGKVTWESDEYTSVHDESCGHLGKHQNGDWRGDDAYTEHSSLEAATRYAEETGHEVVHCRCTD